MNAGLVCIRDFKKKKSYRAKYFERQCICALKDTFIYYAAVTKAEGFSIT